MKAQDTDAVTGREMLDWHLKNEGSYSDPVAEIHARYRKDGPRRHLLPPPEAGSRTRDQRTWGRT